MQVKKPEKRKRIMEVAKKLILEKGIDGFSIDDIVKEARIGKGTVYIYFTSKEELVREIIRRIYASFVEDLRRAIESNTLSEFIEKLVDSFLVDMEVRGGVLQSVRRSSFDSEDLYREFGMEFRKLLKKAFEKFKDELTVGFENFHFSITSFLMSSYILMRELGRDAIRRIVVENLLKVFKCGMDFRADHLR